MKVSVSENLIHISYGIGIITKKIKIDRIKSAEIVRNPMHYGLGIRYIPGGMLYNIHGRDAVELKFKDSKKILRIGSSHCEELKKVIESQIDPKN